MLSKPPEIELIKRTKNYIEENRKKLKLIDRTNNCSDIDLKMYIKLFDEDSHKESAIVREFLKMKRESLQLMSLYDRPKRTQTPESYNKIEQKTE